MIYLWRLNTPPKIHLFYETPQRLRTEQNIRCYYEMGPGSNSACHEVILFGVVYIIGNISMEKYIWMGLFLI